MANLILRANISDRNVDVQYKVLPLPLTENSTELIITPRGDYRISAEDFSFGYLPKEVVNISFVNVGDKVVATVVFSQNIDTKILHNVSLPIISNSRIKVDKFKLIDKTNINDNNNVIVRSKSVIPGSINEHGAEYNITNPLGRKTFVLAKTILSANGYYFNREPSCVISGNKDRYNIISNIQRNSKGIVVGKEFSVYYTSPDGISDIHGEDTIFFEANASKPLVKFRDKVATKKEEYEIYSFDPGRDVSTNGGIKHMVVKGVAGSKFKLIVQDANKKAYNFKTSVFENGGGFLEGTIPPPRGDMGYGEYSIYVKVPKFTVAGSIETIFTSHKPIDHKKLRAKIKQEGVAGALETMKVKSRRKQNITMTSSLTWSFISGAGGSGILNQGVVGSLSEFPMTNLLKNIVTGPGIINSSSKYNESFEVTLIAPTSKVLRIVHQPLHDINTSYVRDQLGGGNDWYTANRYGALYNISASCVGIGTEAAGSSGGFREVTIKGSITGVIFGSADATISLDLDNFLTLQSL